MKKYSFGFAGLNSPSSIRANSVPRRFAIFCCESPAMLVVTDLNSTSKSSLTRELLPVVKVLSVAAAVSTVNFDVVGAEVTT